MRRINGVTLMSVLVVTVLLILLTTTVTISIRSTSEHTSLLRFSTELSLLQSSIDTYYHVYQQYPILSESALLDISNLSQENDKQFSGEKIIENKIQLYLIDYEKLGNLDLVYGKQEDEKDMYAISSVTGKVYYLKGVTEKKNRYFTLTEELQILLLNGKQIDTKIGNPILFIPSKVTWTNENIEVQIKVPKEYQVLSVKANGNEYERQSEKEEFVFYQVQGVGNYEIIVSYQKKDSPKVYTARYYVDHVDTESPQINIDIDHIHMNYEYDSEFYGYYIINDFSDKQSGVKMIKYEYGKMENEVKNYFSNQGISVEEKTIMIKRGYEWITVYIEDYAGNYTVKYIKIE